MSQENDEYGVVSVIEACPTKKIIYIIGEINEDVANDTVTALLSADWNSGIKELHLYITSKGGYLTDCFAIIDILEDIKEKYNIKIFTYGLGEVASAGFFIFIVGDIRKLFPSCRMFVHTHITVGNEKTYEERIKDNKTGEKEIYDNYLKYTSLRLNISTITAKKLLKKNKWLTQKEIRDFNITKDLINEAK